MSHADIIQFAAAIMGATIAVVFTGLVKSSSLDI